MLVKTDLKELNNNVFSLIGNQWMLVTAGTEKSFNTMTASWGGLGVLWNKYVATIYIRPQRYTLEFINKNDFFTLSFFDDSYKDILRYCGAHSGKDVDKVKNSGLEPIVTETGAIIFRQANLTFECKKIYSDQIKEKNIIDDTFTSLIYPEKDYHKIFIGEIVNCMIDK